ncbi:hypothetical protein GALL_470750 [mine drainage metagenome]|uniref:Uncharacterized protein n=1 Tax=mine drainage metagenome TaxID=410659 RepID=A0A1J5PUN6_9ZZZZ
MCKFQMEACRVLLLHSEPGVTGREIALFHWRNATNRREPVLAPSCARRGGMSAGRQTPARLKIRPMRHIVAQDRRDAGATMQARCPLGSTDV